MNWLTSARKFLQLREAQKQHIWGDVEEYMPTCTDQVGKKVGILGYGSIGRQSAFLCPYYLPLAALTSIQLQRYPQPLE